MVKNVYKEEVDDFYLTNDGAEYEKRIDTAVREMVGQLKPPSAEKVERIRMLGYLNMSVQMLITSILSYLCSCFVHREKSLVVST